MHILLLSNLDYFTSNSPVTCANPVSKAFQFPSPGPSQAGVTSMATRTLQGFTAPENMAMGQWENSPFEDAFPIENGGVSNVIVCVQGCIFCFFVWSWYIFLENNLAFEISRWSIRSTCCLLYSTCSSGMLFVMLPSPRTYHVSSLANHLELATSSISHITHHHLPSLPGSYPSELNP